MKKRLLIIISCAFAIYLAYAGGGSIAKAAVDYTSSELSITNVTDIEVHNEYKLNNIVINTNSAFSNLAYDGKYIYKITLEQDGFIKFIVSSKDVYKITNKSGLLTSTKGTIAVTIYRDSNMLFPVTPTVIDKGGEAASSSLKTALDKGTYYLVVQAEPRTIAGSGNNMTISYSEGNAQLIIYSQSVGSDEIYRPSSVGKENLLTVGTAFKSLLTVPNPKDYYVFELKNRGMVQFSYMYDSPKSAKFILYGSNREELLYKTFNGNNILYSTEKYLEPGIYYCSLETTALNDGGRAVLLLNQDVYSIELSQINKKTDSYIEVSTIDNPIEIRWLKGNLKSSELNSSKWKNAKLITDTKMFGVNATGYYTVRVIDAYGNKFMQSINVTSCDTTAPKAPTVKNYTANTMEVTGTAEKNSVVTVKINGSRSFTCNVSSSGNYKCILQVRLAKDDIIEVTAQDLSGNISKVKEVIVK